MRFLVIHVTIYFHGRRRKSISTDVERAPGGTSEQVSIHISSRKKSGYQNVENTEKPSDKVLILSGGTTNY